MDRVLFTLQPHSIIDVITNSSSELFVGKSQNKEEIENLIKEVYPNYLNEYEPLKHIDDLTVDELADHMCWITGSSCYPAKRINYRIPGNFTFDELYEPKSEEPAWNGEIQYELRNNVKHPKNKWDEDFVTDANFDEVKDKLDPNREMYFLFSIDENPDWDMQEKLELFMTRYHLG